MRFLKLCLAMGVGIIVGTTVLSLSSYVFGPLEKATSSYYWSPLWFLIQYALAIWGGIIFFRFFYQKIGGTFIKKDIRTDILSYILQTLLLFQMVVSFGVGNEYSDYISLAVLTIIFFFLQIYFIYKLQPERWSMVMLSMLTMIHIMVLYIFVSEGAETISNKWPAEEYYSQRYWVIGSMILVILLDFVKFIVLCKGKFERLLYYRYEPK